MKHLIVPGLNGGSLLLAFADIPVVSTVSWLVFLMTWVIMTAVWYGTSSGTAKV